MTAPYRTPSPPPPQGAPPTRWARVRMWWRRAFSNDDPRHRVLRILHAYGPMSRLALGDKVSGLFWVNLAMEAMVRELMAEGLIEEQYRDTPQDALMDHRVLAITGKGALDLRLWDTL